MFIINIGGFEYNSFKTEKQWKAAIKAFPDFVNVRIDGNTCYITAK